MTMTMTIAMCGGRRQRFGVFQSDPVVNNAALLAAWRLCFCRRVEYGRENEHDPEWCESTLSHNDSRPGEMGMISSVL